MAYRKGVRLNTNGHPMTKEILLKCASQLREFCELKAAQGSALEVPGLQKGVETPLHWARFPRGACLFTSEILAVWILDCGVSEIPEFANVGPGDDNEQGHSWLVYGGESLDITADQFGEQYPRVHLGPDLDLHTGFRGNGGFTRNLMSELKRVHAEFDAYPAWEIYSEFKAWCAGQAAV